MVEHCSTNAEAMGSNPVEVPKIFLRFICNCLNCNYHTVTIISSFKNFYFHSSHYVHDSQLLIDQAAPNVNIWKIPVRKAI